MEEKLSRVLELSFPCNQIGEYSNYHHKAFIQLTDGTGSRNPQPITRTSSGNPVEDREDGIYEQERSSS